MARGRTPRGPGRAFSPATRRPPLWTRPCVPSTHSMAVRGRRDPGHGGPLRGEAGGPRGALSFGARGPPLPRSRLCRSQLHPASPRVPASELLRNSTSLRVLFLELRGKKIVLFPPATEHSEGIFKKNFFYRFCEMWIFKDCIWLKTSSENPGGPWGRPRRHPRGRGPPGSRRGRAPGSPGLGAEHFRLLG